MKNIKIKHFLTIKHCGSLANDAFIQYFNAVSQEYEQLYFNWGDFSGENCPFDKGNYKTFDIYNSLFNKYYTIRKQRLS